MAAQLAARARGEGRVQPDVLVMLAAIAAAWLAAYWLEVGGPARVLHHHTIFHIAATILALLATWTLAGGRPLAA